MTLVPLIRHYPLLSGCVRCKVSRRSAAEKFAEFHIQRCQGISREVQNTWGLQMTPARSSKRPVPEGWMKVWKRVRALQRMRVSPIRQERAERLELFQSPQLHRNLRGQRGIVNSKIRFEYLLTAHRRTFKGNNVNRWSSERRRDLKQRYNVRDYCICCFGASYIEADEAPLHWGSAVERRARERTPKFHFDSTWRALRAKLSVEMRIPPMFGGICQMQSQLLAFVTERRARDSPALNEPFRGRDAFGRTPKSLRTPVFGEAIPSGQDRWK
jgi:hypothetical protein